MGVAVFALLLVAAVVILIRGAMARFVCPFCGGSLDRAFQKMQCTGCGRLVFMWQAKRRGH